MKTWKEIITVSISAIIVALLVVSVSVGWKATEENASIFVEFVMDNLGVATLAVGIVVFLLLIFLRWRKKWKEEKTLSDIEKIFKKDKWKEIKSLTNKLKNAYDSLDEAMTELDRTKDALEEKEIKSREEEREGRDPIDLQPFKDAVTAAETKTRNEEQTLQLIKNRAKRRHRTIFHFL